MIDTAKAAILVAPEGQRRPPVTAGFVQQSELAAGIPKGHEDLAAEANAHRIAVRLGQLLGVGDRVPIGAEEFAHGRSRPNPA